MCVEVDERVSNEELSPKSVVPRFNPNSGNETDDCRRTDSSQSAWYNRKINSPKLHNKQMIQETQRGGELRIVFASR